MGAETVSKMSLRWFGVGVAGSDRRRSWVDESEERMWKSSLRIYLRLRIPEVVLCSP